MKIMFLGAPGAGKGTQAEIVSQLLSIPSVSTGAIIRSAIREGSEVGLLAKSYIDRGALVPDDVVVGIVKARLAADDCKNGFILDGFPRTLTQAEALEEMGVRLDVVVSIEVPDEEIVDRMSGRRICAGCGATYHVKYNPSGTGDACERCGQSLTIRSDDAPAVVLSRLKSYHAETAPLKDFYAARGILKVVPGQKEVEDTTALTLKALGIERQA